MQLLDVPTAQDVTQKAFYRVLMMDHGHQARTLPWLFILIGQDLSVLQPGGH